ncbi:MAG TPA: transketolase [Cytophagales bacterium]|jgi:pyruvate/2-oxoglutarate/acetoin dehydrogenase E1 component/TPP-dependent pyruvate/acetoin dehydrogenase alpha subunit|nr:transketolase [Cytophagales bacterium]
MSDQLLQIDKKINISKKEILEDYYLINESRQLSLLGRKEVFMGRAKFGVFGDGKELAQIAMSKVFENGDIRSGYYRDQTFMMAIDQLTPNQFFSQLYSDTDVKKDPHSAGRQMNCHFATRMLNDSGEWKTLTDIKNSTSDISCVAGQMPRLVGLAYASKLYRNNSSLSNKQNFSINGNEVAFGTIGDAGTSEGHFWETMNAAGVLQIPLVMSIWDDGYGISVPSEYHTTRNDLSKVLSGFQRSNKNEKGFELFQVKGWDYVGLIKTYRKAILYARNEHVPCIIHVKDVTQPQGHTTSGSHERYKSKERLKWEGDFCCIKKMKEWIIKNKIADLNELYDIEISAGSNSKKSRNSAWKSYRKDINEDLQDANVVITRVAQNSPKNKKEIISIKNDLNNIIQPLKSDIQKSLKYVQRIIRSENNIAKNYLINLISEKSKKYFDEYSSHLYSQSKYSALNIEEVSPIYSKTPNIVDGREVINKYFDGIFKNNPLVFAVGEDVGLIGGVNQGFAGIQKKYGKLRITDTGVREASIIGQGIGAAMRGLRPIVEIQYLDYVYWAIQTLSDDLSTLQYRTKGGQKAPVIIRTRGHRLEGIWHSGSPMGTLINSLRGIHILTPRNFVEACGMYNTLLDSDEPGLMIEPLNSYRLKENLPTNLDKIRVEFGVPYILKEGNDITIVTYGSMCKIVMETSDQLEKVGISCEIIDVRTLLPFDKNKTIVESVKKTNRILFADEDVSGGASAFMMQNVLERQNGYYYLDSKPLSITSMDHRPAYSTDGDYFSKPNCETIFEKIYKVFNELDSRSYPSLF